MAFHHFVSIANGPARPAYYWTFARVLGISGDDRGGRRAVSAYTVMLAGTVLLWGRLADRLT